MIVISYSMSLRELDDYVKNHNAHHQQLGQQIRQGISATAKNIIRLYGQRLSKIKPEVLDTNNLPPLRTNNVYLAKLSNTSSRTIQRHLKRLMETGIITRKKFRGSRANYELWINPKLLFINPLDRVGNPSQRGLNLIADNQLFTRKNTSSCLNRETGNNNNIIKGLGKCPGQGSSYKLGNTCCGDLAGHTGEKVQRNVTERKKADRTCNAEGTGYTGEKVQKNASDREKTGNTGCENLTGHTGEKMQKNTSERKKSGNTGCENLARCTGQKGKQEIEEMKGAGKKVRLRTNSQETRKTNTSNFDEVRSASLSLYTSLLWALAKKVLYADVFLTKRQCEIGLQLIRKWYEPVATERLPAIHQVYVSRIGLVRKFLDKDPKNRFVQLPYLYFDVHNSSGFAGTKKWWLKQQDRNIEIGEKLMLHHQIKKLTKNKNKDGHHRSPTLKLYLECEAKVRKLDNPQLLQEFYTTISNQFMPSLNA